MTSCRGAPLASVGGFFAFFFFFFFKCDGYICICGKAHGAVFDSRDLTTADEVVVPFMVAFTAIFFGQLDTVADNPVNGANMNAVRADDFCMFLNLGKVCHDNSPDVGKG